MNEAHPAVGPEAAIVDLLQAHLANGSGDHRGRLPTERQLALTSGFSRATVRRALGKLEARGEIVRQVGRGTFLSPARSQELHGTAPAGGTSPAEIMAVRLLIEPQAMPLVVAAATAADLAELHRCLEGGETAYAFEEFEVWDEALHVALAKATHNLLLVRLYEMLNDARHQPLWGNLKRRSYSPAGRDANHRDHQQIVSAIVERDPDLAQAAMRGHLLRVRTQILGDMA